MARNFTETIKAQVRDRANGLCEYCHAVEKWQFVDLKYASAIAGMRDILIHH